MAGRKIVQNAIFHGIRHDNKILKVKILFSRNFVVMAQAPRNAGTACVSECVLITLACRGLRVGPSKLGASRCL